MRFLPSTLVALALTTACTRGTSDTADTFTSIVNEDDADSDFDGTPDDEDAFPDDPTEDTDSDGDGTGDNSDAFPEDPTEDTDSDGDGTGDNSDAFPEDATEDTDSDGDGYGDNAQDAFPDDATEWADTDADTIGDNADNCINAENADQADADEDGVGDVCEGDRDSDGVLDDDDVFPDDPNESVDTDEDGYGDNGDAFPSDPNEWADTDEDTIGDNADNCVDVVNDAQEDADEDGEGDACDDDRDGDGTPNADDAFPDDAAEDTDTDADGYGDNNDAFPSDPNEWADTDGDTYGDNTDVFPEDDTEWADTDEDGYGDNGDAFPEDPTEWADTDGDTYGDNTDAFPEDDTEWADTDGDTYGDNTDAFPNDNTEWADADGDTYGDNEDDAFPNDPNEWADSDTDTIGDNADNCVNTANTNQANLDEDALGDACDSDADGDGVDAGPDCNDLDDSINPNVKETYYDGIDQDCSGGSDFDADGDGVDSKAETSSGTDCDDTDANNIGCGGSADSAFAGTCKSLLAADSSTPDGDYWFDFDGESGTGEAIELACEMDGVRTVGGSEADVGSGWTVLTPCDLQNKLGGSFTEVVAANIEFVEDDGECRPRAQGTTGFAYNWTGEFAGGYQQILPIDYQAYSNDGGGPSDGNTSDLGHTNSTWTSLYSGTVGDIIFGDPAQSPVGSFVEQGVVGGRFQREAIDYPGNGTVIDLPQPATAFGFGWGEVGGQSEGWYPWWSGEMLVR